MTLVPLNCWSESDQTAIRKQMDRILNSGPFRQSRRRQQLLEYLVNETLAGRGERLKAYNVAREVFDRSEGFDSNVDPLVRIEAARLRDRLREYYEVDGQSDPIRIDLPKGAYKPKIEFRKPTAVRPHVGAENRHPDLVEGPAALADDQRSPELPWWNRGARWRTALSALALIVALGAATVWLTRDRWIPAPKEAAEDPVLGVPKGPGIAVLPFVNLSGDPKQDYFSDGLTEDISTELSRARDLRVLARNTTFQYKGKAVDVMKLGRELGVRYVLEGSIQRINQRLRVSAQLIDTEIGSQVWADRFDREMADIFLVQDEIVSEIFAKIAGSYGVIESTEAQSGARKSPEQIQAYDLILRAHERMQWEWNRENFSAAREFLRQASALDRGSARARREVAWLAIIGWIFGYDDKPMLPQEIAAQATEAVQLDPKDARARMVLASSYFFNKQLDLFEHEAEQAMMLAPYDAEILATLGCMIAKSGQWQRGVALVTKANALNADAAAGWYHSAVALDHYLNGDYERALAVMRQNPDQAPYTRNYSIPIYGQLGRKQEAQEDWRKLHEEERSGSVDRFQTWYRKWNFRDEDITKLMDGVYKSGVLELEAKFGQ